MIRINNCNESGADEDLEDDLDPQDAEDHKYAHDDYEQDLNSEDLIDQDAVLLGSH
jgi:thiamine phosphate synthase YjbQ (UPF0047 family)